LALHCRKMKILAWVLGLLALCSTIAVFANWFHDHKQARIAAADARKFAGLAADIDFGNRLQRQADEMRVANDEKKIENDNLDIQIAELRGKGIQRAYDALAGDKAMLSGDELVVRLSGDIDSMGGDPRVANAQDRQQAATASMNVYAAGLQRDVHLAYLIGVVWLAFGFACALAAKG
jgi:hypothetical protein